MSEPTVLVATSGAVRTITLNRPQSLNSFTADMHRLLRNALEAAASDTAVRCVVLTGSGRAFCAGQVGGDALHRLGRGARLRVEQAHPVPGRRRHLGDAATHAARADDRDDGAGVQLVVHGAFRQRSENAGARLARNASTPSWKSCARASSRCTCASRINASS